VLLGPIETIALTMRVNDFLVAWEQRRGSNFPNQWADLQNEIRLLAQRTVDEGHGRPYRAGGPPINAEPKFERRKRLGLRGPWHGVFDEGRPRQPPVGGAAASTDSSTR
jgi:hypothetical protein